MFRKLAASLLFLLGAATAVVVGIWLCLVEGLEEIINACQASSPVNASALAWGLVKVFLLAEIAFYGAIVGGWVLSYVVWTGETKRERARRLARRRHPALQNRRIHL